MDPQRPPDCRNQAYLKASGSKKEKEMKELLDLAKDVKDESVFQQKNRYKKFKAKNHTIQSHEIKSIIVLFGGGLLELEYYKECIYWCKQVIHDVRLCDSPERSVALFCIVRAFCGLDDFENVFEYGEKYLEISRQPISPKERYMRKILFSMMKDASMKLNKLLDDFKYAKEILKLNVVRYNAHEIEKGELLYSYWLYIKVQMEIDDFKSAKKTVKHIKLFSLNSMDSNDVIKAMENEGFGKFFPLNNLLNGSEINEEKKTEFFKSNSDLDSLEVFSKEVAVYYYVSNICWQKQELLMSLGEICKSFEWGHLALNILNDIHLHLDLWLNFSRKQAFDLAQYFNKVLTDIIGLTLILADKDYLNREHLFSQLSKKMEKEVGDIFRYISGALKSVSLECMSAQRCFSNLDVQKVIPFLEFWLRSLNRGPTSIEPTKLKVELATFKNSLAIMNHFRAKFKAKESQ